MTGPSPLGPRCPGRGGTDGGGPTCGGMAEREGQGSGVVADPRGVLRQGRVFLDYFWDIAKPEQEVRLAATENLLQHLREGKKVRRGPGPGPGVVGSGSGMAGCRPGLRRGRGGGGPGAPRGSEERGHRRS